MHVDFEKRRMLQRIVSEYILPIFSQAIQWLKDLIQSMLARSEEIGETAAEADDLFLQHIRFQEAGKVKKKKKE